MAETKAGTRVQGVKKPARAAARTKKAGEIAGVGETPTAATGAAVAKVKAEAASTKADAAPQVFAAVRVRGSQDIIPSIELTLEQLRLTRTNHCVLVPKTPQSSGMLKKAKDFVTWGDINQKTLERLVAARGRVSSSRPLAKEDVADVVKNLAAGNISAAKIKPVFRLQPPRKGWERGRRRKAFTQKGSLGYRGAKINELLERMI